MSSYIDHRYPLGTVFVQRGHMPDEALANANVNSWTDFTLDRLAWLYGPYYASERAAMTAADVQAWRNLGRRSAA